MAKLWITEFKYTAQRPSAAPIAPLTGDNRDANSGVIVTKVKTFSSATAMDAVGDETRYVRVWSDTDCLIEASLGESPATPADQTSLPLAAKTAEYFSVAPGTIISVVALS